MQVTKITEQVKNKNRASIYIDSKYSFSLTLDQLLKLYLKVGQEIDKSELEFFKKTSQEGKLKVQAINWLIIRPRSTNELRDYLKRKKLDQEGINSLVKELQDKKYQDNNNFTRWWIEQRLNKNRSTRFIKYELKTKGISDEIVNKLLQNSDKEILKKLIAKKRQLKKYQDKNKLIEYLLRQGFNYSDVKELFAE